VPNRLPVLRLLTAGVALSLLSVAGPAAAAGGGPSGHSRAEQAQATAALAKAERLFDRPVSARTKGGVVGSTGRDATLVLRDLVGTADALPTVAQRRVAHGILARPTDGNPEADEFAPKYVQGHPVGSDCGAHICVHWVEDRTADSVHGGTSATGNDSNVATIPTFVKDTLTTMEHVYATEVTRMGYRTPISDGTLGGDGKTDVYLADVGADNYYGYCTSDGAGDSQRSQIDAYCVLDNDYRPGQFRVHTPLQNLQVTAAHEFFHAVQFAYDAYEDDWLMEGTAAWMEDQVYDGVNDNRQYLAASQLAAPFLSLDAGAGGAEYGAWIFWRYLSESAGSGAADDPTVVRDVWNATVGEDNYSMLALRRVLNARGSSVTRAYTTFGTWIRSPRRYFSEGTAYRAAPLDRSATLTRSHTTSPAWSVSMDHLTHSFARFTPGGSLKRQRHLRVTLNLPYTSKGAAARAIVHRKDGSVLLRPIALNWAGNGTRTLTFNHSTVSYVELDLVNASTRYDCWQGASTSCQGLALDDGLTAHLTGKAVR
jgi:hypothetical protein